MDKILLSLSTGVFLASALIYIFCRWIFSGLISNETGDWFLWSGSISLFIIAWSKSKLRDLGPMVLCIGSYDIWGLFTKYGQRQYSEMPGLIPFYFLITSIFLLIINFKRRKSKRITSWKIKIFLA